MKGRQREILALCGLALCSACGDDTVLVHRAVSATVDHYAPGFTVGGALRQNAARLSSGRWVPQVGGETSGARWPSRKMILRLV